MFLTAIGRATAPIFLFLASEAFHYTRNRKVYALRLLVGFWIVGVCSMLIQKAFPLDDVILINNIFGTLFLSIVYMWVVDSFIKGIKNRNGKSIFLSIIAGLIPVVFTVVLLALAGSQNPLARYVMILFPTPLTVEGGVIWIFLAVAFYLFRRHRLVQVAILLGLAVLTFVLNGGVQWAMALAAIPILLYNGKPGRKSKWFFYIFYPAHIYILYLISYFMH